MLDLLFSMNYYLQEKIVQKIGYDNMVFKLTTVQSLCGRTPLELREFTVGLIICISKESISSTPLSIGT